MIQAIIDINPDADGVRCGECVGPFLRLADSTGMALGCEQSYWDCPRPGDVGAHFRGPECLAAANRSAVKDAEIVRLREALQRAADADYVRGPEDGCEVGCGALLKCEEQFEAENAALKVRNARMREALQEARSRILGDTCTRTRNGLIVEIDTLLAEEAKP